MPRRDKHSGMEPPVPSSAFRDNEVVLNFLRHQNDRLQTELTSGDRQERMIHDKNVRAKMSRYHKELDHFTQLIESEKRGIRDKERRIKAVLKLEIDFQKRRGGVAASQQNVDLMTRQVQVLEGRLERSLERYNEFVMANKEKRRVIDEIREDRAAHDKMYHRMTMVVWKAARRQRSATRLASEEELALNEAREELAKIRATARRAYEKFESKWRKEVGKLQKAQMLNASHDYKKEYQEQQDKMDQNFDENEAKRDAEHEAKLRAETPNGLPESRKDRISRRSAKTRDTADLVTRARQTISMKQSHMSAILAGMMGGRSKGGGLKGAHRHRPSTAEGIMTAEEAEKIVNKVGSLSREEEVTLKRNLFKHKWNIAKSKVNIATSKTQLGAFQALFQQLEEMTGVSDVGEMAMQLVAHEERRQELFGSVQYMSAQVTEAEDEVRARQREIKQFHSNNTSKKTSASTVLDKLEVDVETLNRQAEWYERENRHALSSLDHVRNGLADLLSKVGPPTESILSPRRRSASLHHSPRAAGGAAEKALRASTVALLTQDTENSMIQTLGLLEARARELQIADGQPENKGEICTQRFLALAKTRKEEQLSIKRQLQNRLENDPVFTDDFAAEMMEAMGTDAGFDGAQPLARDLALQMVTRHLGAAKAGAAVRLNSPLDMQRIHGSNSKSGGDHDGGGTGRNNNASGSRGRSNALSSRRNLLAGQHQSSSKRRIVGL